MGLGHIAPDGVVDKASPVLIEHNATEAARRGSATIHRIDAVNEIDGQPRVLELVDNSIEAKLALVCAGQRSTGPGLTVDVHAGSRTSRHPKRFESG